MSKRDAALENVTSERREFLKKMLAGGAVVALPMSSTVVFGEDDDVAEGGKGKGKGGGKGKGKGKGGGKGKGKGKGKGSGGSDEAATL